MAYSICKIYTCLLYIYYIFTIYLLYLYYIYIYYLMMVCIYIASNAGFQIYRITIIHIHISYINYLKYILSARFWSLYERVLITKDFPSTSFPALVCSFFPQTPMATAKRTWKKVYSICNICNQFHWKHIMAIYLQMLRYYLEYWCRRYKDTHKVMFTKKINKYVFWYCCASCYVLCAFCATIFCYVCIYIYIRIQQYIIMCNLILGSDVVFLCMSIAHLFM